MINNKTNLSLNFAINLSQARDFIMGSVLARKALETRSIPKLTNFISDLISYIHKLSDSCNLQEFTDHGLPHLCSVVDRASSWSLKNGKSISAHMAPKDCAILICGLLIHDLGMLSQNPNHLSETHKISHSPVKYRSTPEWVRATHVHRLPNLFKEFLKEYNYTYDKSNKEFVNDIIAIAISHSKWPWDWERQTFCQDFITNSSRKLTASHIARLNKMAGIIAVCDVLDEDSSRCDTRTLVSHRSGNELSKAHWLRHCLTMNRVIILNSEISINLAKLPDCQDEILKPVFSALRNHYRIVNFYDKVLDNFKIKKINFSAATGVPTQVNNEVGDWKSIPGFSTEHALCIQLLSTFFPIVLKKDEDKSLKDKIISASLEDVDTSEYNYIDGDYVIRGNVERSFLALLHDKSAIHEAYDYLKKCAVEAHYSGDGAKVLYYCTLAIENLKTIDNSKLSPFGQNKPTQLIDDIAFDTIEWSFSLYIIWGYHNNNVEFTSWGKIRSIEFAEEKDNIYIGHYKNFIYLLLGMLNDIHCSANKKKNHVNAAIDYLNKFEAYWRDSETIGLLIGYFAEILWVKRDDAEFSEKNDFWLLFIDQFQKKYPDVFPSQLKELKHRLHWQAYLLYRDHLPEEEKKNEIPIEKCFEQYYSCSRDDLKTFVRELKQQTKYETDEYIPFSQLICMCQYLLASQTHTSLASATESKKEPLNAAFTDHIQENYNHAIEFSKLKDVLHALPFGNFIEHHVTNLKVSKNNNYSYAIFVLIHALRHWYMMFTNDALSTIADFLKYSQNYLMAIYYYIITKETDVKTNQNLQICLNEFPSIKSSSELKIFFNKLLELPREKEFRTHEMFSLLEDTVPDELLNKLARWCIALENNKHEPATGAKLTYLSFWKNIFPYLQPHKSQEISDILWQYIKNMNITAPILHELSEVIRQVLSYQSSEEKMEFIYNKFTKLTKDSYDSNSLYITWNLIYQSCLNNHELCKKCNSWLEENAPADPACFVLFYNKISHNEQKYKEALSELKKLIIKSVEKALEEKDIPTKYNSGILLYYISWVKWDINDKALINSVIMTIGNDMSNCILLYQLTLFIAWVYTNSSTALMMIIKEQTNKILVPARAKLSCDSKQTAYFSAQIFLCSKLLKNSDAQEVVRAFIQQTPLPSIVNIINKHSLIECYIISKIEQKTIDDFMDKNIVLYNRGDTENCEFSEILATLKLLVTQEKITLSDVKEKFKSLMEFCKKTQFSDIKAEYARLLSSNPDEPELQQLKNDISRKVRFACQKVNNAKQEK